MCMCKGHSVTPKIIDDDYSIRDVPALYLMCTQISIFKCKKRQMFIRRREISRLEINFYKFTYIYSYFKLINTVFYLFSFSRSSTYIHIFSIINICCMYRYLYSLYYRNVYCV